MMEFDVESPESLVQHPIAESENVICHMLVTVTGYSKDDLTDDEVTEDIRKLMAETMMELARKGTFSQRINSVHTFVEVFDPQIFFGDTAHV